MHFPTEQLFLHSGFQTNGTFCTDAHFAFQFFCLFFFLSGTDLPFLPSSPLKESYWDSNHHKSHWNTCTKAHTGR